MASANCRLGSRRTSPPFSRLAKFQPQDIPRSLEEVDYMGVVKGDFSLGSFPPRAGAVPVFSGHL